MSMSSDQFRLSCNSLFKDQAEAAKALGIHQTTISLCRNGHRPINPTVERLISALSALPSQDRDRQIAKFSTPPRQSFGATTTAPDPFAITDDDC